MVINDILANVQCHPSEIESVSSKIKVNYMCLLEMLVNSLWPGDTALCPEFMSTALQVIACCLKSITSLPNEMLPYYQLNPLKQN